MASDFVIAGSRAGLSTVASGGSGTYVTPGVGAVTGSESSGSTATSAGALDDVTTSATGAAPDHGTGAATLDHVVASAAASLAAKGTGSSTLSDVSTAATGAVRIDGGELATLSDVTVSSTGAVVVQGSVSIILADVANAASSIIIIAAAATAILEDATVSATAGIVLPTADGTASQVLDDVAVSAAAQALVRAASALTLVGVDLSAVAVIRVAGALQEALQGVTVSAAGGRGAAGEVVITVSVEADGQGAISVRASFAQALDDVTLVAGAMVDVRKASLVLAGVTIYPALDGAPSVRPLVAANEPGVAPALMGLPLADRWIA